MQSSHRGSVCLTLCLLGGVLTPEVSRGQQVAWENDYGKARRTAAAQYRPLIVAVGSAGCAACSRLHATTFQDREIARAISRQFLPLKLDANEHAPIVEALRIGSFPTVIFAAPDGTILHAFEGYVGAGTLREHMDHALRRLREHEAHRQSQGVSQGQADVQPAARTAAAAAQTAPWWDLQPSWRWHTDPRAGWGTGAGSPWTWPSSPASGGYTSPGRC